MTLPTSGPIAFSDINIELGLAGTTSANINQASYRTLAGIPSGAISLASFYGKSNTFSFSIASNQTDADLRTLALAAGWNGTSAVAASINSGIYVYATNIASPAALTINGSWPNGVTLINNGFIMGMGGLGGYANNSIGGGYGTTGGPAIVLGVNASIVNNSYIGGGGGGGGGASYGGGGGGAGGAAGGDSQTYGVPGGAGGGAGAAGADGSVGTYGGKSVYYLGGGGGGGRILPGTGGAGGANAGSPSANGKGGGSGGGGGNGDTALASAGAGGSAGAVGAASSSGGGGGGGWGAAGGTSSSGKGGGAGGKAIALNGFTATRTGAGTTYGVVS